MKTIQIEVVARDIVNTIKPVVGNRTINVMNVGGVIIASSDPRRIGTLHHGAAEAAASRKVVRIRPEDVAAYPGSKEGINLPVVKNGELLGVVGIYGVPEEVEQAANLLGICVDLYLDQAQNVKKTQLRKDLRLAMIRRMLLGEQLDKDELLASGRELSLDLRLPMRAAVVEVENKSHGRRYGMEVMDRAHGMVSREGWVDDNRDVFAVVDDALIMFKHTPPGFDGGEFIRVMHQGLAAELGVGVTAALGGACEDWRQLVASHREARELAAMFPGECVDIDDRTARTMYMLGGCLRPSVADRHLLPMHQALAKGFGEREMDRVMRTVRAYLDADCRCGAAAERLGIHKNTMNYRINKIFSLAGLSRDTPFVREFFLRLLFLRHSRES